HVVLRAFPTRRSSDLSVTLFWGVLLAALICAVIAQPAARFRRQVQIAGILAVLVLLVGYAMQFGLAAAFGPGLLLTCGLLVWALDRKSTRLNSSHVKI